MDTCPDSTQNTRVTGNRTEHAPKTAHAVSMETRGGRKQSDTVHVLSLLSWEITYTHRLTNTLKHSLAPHVTTNLISHATKKLNVTPSTEQHAFTGTDSRAMGKGYILSD